jgi:hypothetical protein
MLLPSRFSLAALASLLATAPLAAQQVDRVDTLAVAPGSRLRATTRAGARLKASSFTRQTPDSLVLSFECESCMVSESAVAWSDLRRVERYAGRSSGRGALVGVGVGLLAGTVVGAVGARMAINDCAKLGNDFCGLNALLVPVGSVIGIVGGAVIGAVIGRDRWVRVWPNAPRP